MDLVKFEHTLFALPFAYMGAFLAAKGHPGWISLGWITLAMVAARTAGMALNRLVDQELDARNPRTANRPLPRGLLKRSQVWVLVAVSLVLLVVSAWKLNMLCLAFTPAAVVLLFAYSYLKRFTWLSHLALGVLLGCAPVGGWIGASGTLSWPPIVLGAAVILWVAGFDIIYACQDVVFDRKEGLHSIPAAFGIPRALAYTRVLHLVTMIMLSAVGIMCHLGPWYFGGLVVAALLLIHEHRIVSPRDLTRLNEAFFNTNGWLSVTLLAFTLANFLT